MTTSTNPIPVHRHPRVTWSRLKLKWPFLVWLLAVGLIAWLYQDTIRTGTVAGVIEVIREEPAPTETARLETLAIHEGQQVKPGDLIARFDTSILDAQIAEIQSAASKDQLELATHAAELAASFQLDHTELERQIEAAIGEGEIRHRDLNLQYQLDLAKLDVLSNQLRQINGLIGSTTTEARDLVVYRSELETLTRRTALYPPALRAIEGDIARARAQLATAQNATNALAPVTSAIAAQERYASARKLITALEKRKEHYTLRATNPGTVARINARPGTVVPAATPVATLVIETPPRILAYVPDWMIHQVALGTEGLVTRPLTGGETFKATVTTIGPEIATLPGVASVVAGMPIRGRRVVLTLNTPAGLMPGESLAIRFGDPAWVVRLRAIRARFTGEPAKPATL